ncbi:MAG: hypothetical protein RBR15_02575 [Sphaerochaeta sp.]|nr:hypothetical protein [Sphaerochaeta sp.]
MKTIKVCAVLLIPLLFTGCLDIFHSLSIHDGEIDLAVRYTVQTALVHMINEFSDEEIDVTELLHEAESIIPAYDGFSLDVKKIETSFHTGAEVRIRGSMDKVKAHNEQGLLLPIRNTDHYSILIPSMAGEEELDSMAAVFLSGAKYTMLIDLSGDLQDIKEARLKYDGKIMHPDDEDSQILVSIYGSSMLIEIPMLFLLYAPENFSLELY